MPAGSQLESMPDPVKNFWEAPSTPYMWKHSHVRLFWKQLWSTTCPAGCRALKADTAYVVCSNMVYC